MTTLSIDAIVGEVIGLRSLFLNGTPTGAGTWTQSPEGANISGQSTETEGELAGAKALFTCSTAGAYTVTALIPLADGQSRAAKFAILVT